MDDLKACRTCLTMGGKMFEIHGQFQQYLKEILGHKILYSADLPQYLCCECVAVLAKSYNFKMKCLASQTALFNILQDQNQITEKDLRSIDRRKLQLESKLTYFAVPACNTFVLEHEGEHFEEVEVKQEINEEESLEDALMAEPFPAVKEESAASDSDDNDTKGGDIYLGSASEDSDYEPAIKIKKKKQKAELAPNKIESPYKCDSCYTGFQAEEAFNKHMALHAMTNSEPPSPDEPPPVAVKKRPGGAKPLTKLQRKKLEGDVVHLMAYRRSKAQHNSEADKIAYDTELEEHFTVIQLTPQQQIAKLRLRKNAPNYRDSPYKCDLCFIGYLQEETYNNHMARHEVTFGDYECDVCQLSMKHRNAFSVHTVKHALRFHCHRCGFVADDQDQAMKHKACHQQVTLKCQHCDVVSASLGAHVAHVRRAHSAAAAGLCAACGYGFSSRGGLRAHRERVHPDTEESQSAEAEADGAQADGESNPRCAECELDFATLADRRRHLLTDERHAPAVDIDVSASCPMCGLRCASVPALRVHRRLHALGAAARRLAAARRARGPLRHRLAASRGHPDHGDEAYPAQCEHCEESMASRLAHFQHYKSKHKDRAFPVAGDNMICDQCGRGFPTNALLAYHARSHSERPRLQCPSCAKPFFSEAKLAAHLRSHDQSELACPVCGKTFRTKLGRDQHVANHSLAGAHPCIQCGATFPRAAGLALHVKKRHRSVAPPPAPTARSED